MKLVITEKPSVAQTIAKSMGITGRKEGYVEGKEFLVSWCIGHLVELCPPESYGDHLRRWRMDTLPIIPEQWLHRVSEGTQKQYECLAKLMNRSDVDTVVCATDAGREGELIFRLVYHQAGCKKPVERLWLSSMEDEAIREGFRNLKPGSKYDNLYRAALCREQADWLVGMNATRLFSCLYGQTLPMGRVMSPTLAMIAQREEKIQTFVPKEHFTVKLDLGVLEASGEKLEQEEDAQRILEECRNAQYAEVVECTRKERKENPPPLHDLTSLQREANRELGFTAQQTLDYAQALYEKKLITYPRTDSKYLPEDMEGEINELCMTSAQIADEMFPMDANSRRICNDEKVSDHHAIIVTQTARNAQMDQLPSGEQKILQFLARRCLAAVDRPFRFEETVVVLDCNGHEFKAKGQVVLEKGWRLYDREEKKRNRIPDNVAKGDRIPLLGANIQTGKSTPPERYTEDTILSAMETAGKEDMPEEAERKGIGTPATRASTLEKLIRCGYMERQGDKKKQHLYPTEKGRNLVQVIPEVLASAQLTAQWEQMLLEIEKGKMHPDSFMESIEEMVRTLCAQTEANAESPLIQDHSVGQCPHCGKPVMERKNGFFCDACRFALWKDNRFFGALGKTVTREVAEKLLKDGYAVLNNCKSKRTGKRFTATVNMALEDDGAPRFSLAPFNN